MDEPILPRLPLHVGDWRRDPRIRRLSKADRCDVLELLMDLWIEGAPAEEPGDVSPAAWSEFVRLSAAYLATRAEMTHRYEGAVRRAAEARRQKALRLALKSGLRLDLKKGLKSGVSPSPSSSSSSKKKTKAPLAMLADPLFDAFWVACPRRVSRVAAEKAWAKLDERSRKLAAAAMRVQGPLIAQREPQYRPHPATWLNDHRWEDEPEAAGAPPPRYVTAADTRKALEADTEQHDPAVAAGLGDLLGKLKQGRG